MDKLYACCCMVHWRKLGRTPDDIIKAFKLQTRKMHQTENAILIPPFREASNSKSRNFFNWLLSKLRSWIYNLFKLLSFVSLLLPQKHLSYLIAHIIRRSNLGGSSSASPSPEIKYLHIHPVLSNHEYMWLLIHQSVPM